MSVLSGMEEGQVKRQNTYTALLIGRGGRRTLRNLTQFYGHEISVEGGRYVLITEPPTIPPDGQECVYRFEAVATSACPGAEPHAR